ncbi:MAG: RNA 2',3'-cyclic phosphodiesterase [Actinomycetota bacterium]|nr:RNA 2',3'-cyclic phosphodiesterase [Actinomycetota bacterium]
MSEPRDGVARARLFVALELPTYTREALVRWRDAAVGDGGGLRLIAPEHLHATLCFLGWQRVEDVSGIFEACGAVARRRAAELSVGGGIWLPRRRPRVLAVEREDPGGELSATQAELSGALAAGGWYVPEKRPFLAHVTVARVAAARRPRASEVPASPKVRFEGSRVTLYRSRLGPGDARYEPLGTVELTGA